MAHSFLVRLSPAIAKRSNHDQVPQKSQEPFGGRPRLTLSQTSAVGPAGVGQRITSSAARFPERSVLSSRSFSTSDNPPIERLPDGITSDTPLRLVDIVR